MQIDEHDELMSTQRIANDICEKKFEKMCDDEINTFEIIINEEYDQVRNVHNVIKKDLHKLRSRTNSISKREINQL